MQFPGVMLPLGLGGRVRGPAWRIIIPVIADRVAYTSSMVFLVGARPGRTARIDSRLHLLRQYPRHSARLGGGSGDRRDDDDRDARRAGWRTPSCSDSSSASLVSSCVGTSPRRRRWSAANAARSRGRARSRLSHHGRGGGLVRRRLVPQGNIPDAARLRGRRKKGALTDMERPLAPVVVLMKA